MRARYLKVVGLSSEIVSRRVSDWSINGADELCTSFLDLSSSGLVLMAHIQRFCFWASSLGIACEPISHRCGTGVKQIDYLNGASEILASISNPFGAVPHDDLYISARLQPRFQLPR